MQTTLRVVAIVRQADAIQPHAGGRLLRRMLLARGARLAALAAPGAFAAGTTACVRSSGPPRAPGALLLLAPTGPPGSEGSAHTAKVRRWNERHDSGPALELVAPPAALLASGRNGHAPATPSQLSTLAASGQARPALVWIDHQDVPLLAARHLFQSIGGHVRRSHFDLKRFMPQALQSGYGLDDRLYALPGEIDTRQLYFNREHFAAAGIDFRRAGFDFERPAITWDALRRVNLDLVSAISWRQRLPFPLGHEGAPMELWGWQNGGEWLSADGRRATFDRPENIEALAWMVAHAREIGDPLRHLVLGFPPPASAGSAADEPERHPFVAGRVSICYESTRFMSTLVGHRPDFPVGYVEPPRRQLSGPLVSWCHSWGYGLVAGAPDEAWEALQFLVDEEATRAGVAEAARVSGAPAAGDIPGGNAAERALLAGAIAGRLLWFPPFTGQLRLDQSLARLYRTGIKLMDEGRDHGMEQLRHARSRPRCLAPRDIWPLVADARQRALQGADNAAAALKTAGRQAQTALDSAARAGA